MDKKLDATIIKYLLVIFGLLLIYNYSSTIVVLMGFMLNVLRPLIIGGLIAYLLNIIVVRLERSLLRKIKATKPFIARVISVVSAVFIVGLVIYLIIKLIVPQVLTILTGLVQGLPLLVSFADSNFY